MVLKSVLNGVFVDLIFLRVYFIPQESCLCAVCLDGSPPGYHLHRGKGVNARNWVVFLEVSPQTFVVLDLIFMLYFGLKV